MPKNEPKPTTTRLQLIESSLEGDTIRLQGTGDDGVERHVVLNGLDAGAVDELMEALEEWHAQHAESSSAGEGEGEDD